MSERNPNVVVTGGGSGIGLAIARVLHERGFQVTVCGRNEAKLQRTGLSYAVMDVCDDASIAEALQRIGRCDVFVANAGAARTAPALKTDKELWDAMIAVNLASVVRCSQMVIPQMLERKQGRFIAIASTASVKGYAYSAAYSAAKHGVLGWIRSLAIELAKSGVTANAVCPGFTDTPLLENALDAVESRTGRVREEVLDQFVKGNPMGRLIDPAEVAEAVAWLASEGAASVNGQAILIDGGETIS
ncbi:3-hydroxyacyl-CoA dehydrogenase [Erythrobacter sp. KY5]|uniref:SDR family NAD(P)-dependent oxidoreductase n=1 Tax=Erythrobacter sp. KY5 TaxID=2011159 RepID=UPI000DBF3405|nr:SDR family oxidoreductase [Erythrobacter sp. KY5]AWW74400.1 3-hydroxyacyl-CoA dehydrogenase [Erythrobacter sp. KY5]